MSLRTGIWVVTFVGLAALLAVPAWAADNLPVPVANYAALCQQSGGSAVTQLTGGVGMVQCQWASHGHSECEVGGNQVNVCGIFCSSNDCLKDNPARYSPRWPLQGGPASAALPTQPGSGILN